MLLSEESLLPSELSWPGRQNLIHCSAFSQLCWLSPGVQWQIEVGSWLVSHLRRTLSNFSLSKISMMKNLPFGELPLSPTSWRISPYHSLVTLWFIFDLGNWGRPLTISLAPFWELIWRLFFWASLTAKVNFCLLTMLSCLFYWWGWFASVVSDAMHIVKHILTYFTFWLGFGGSHKTFSYYQVLNFLGSGGYFYVYKSKLEIFEKFGKNFGFLRIYSWKVSGKLLKVGERDSSCPLEGEEGVVSFMWDWLVWTHPKGFIDCLLVILDSSVYFLLEVIFSWYDIKDEQIDPLSDFLDLVRLTLKGLPLIL